MIALKIGFAIYLLAVLGFVIHCTFAWREEERLRRLADEETQRRMKEIAAARAGRQPDDLCERCGGRMRPGVALVSTEMGGAADLDNEVVTMHHGGPGRLISCLKCPLCGHSRKEEA